MITKQSTEPLYGTIPYFAGTWHVTYQPVGSCTSKTLSGYGDFPFDRFKIPVIDFRNASLKQLSAWLTLPNDVYNSREALVQAELIGLNIIHEVVK